MPTVRVLRIASVELDEFLEHLVSSIERCAHCGAAFIASASLQHARLRYSHASHHWCRPQLAAHSTHNAALPYWTALLALQINNAAELRALRNSCHYARQSFGRLKFLCHGECVQLQQWEAGSWRPATARELAGVLARGKGARHPQLLWRCLNSTSLELDVVLQHSGLAAHLAEHEHTWRFLLKRAAKYQRQALCELLFKMRPPRSLGALTSDWIARWSPKPTLQ